MRRLGCTLALLLLTACPLFGGGGRGGACTDDANLCADGGELEVDASCERDDMLQLELGDGNGEFQPLAPGVSPELYAGQQGGEHMVLGLGVDNPSPEHLSYEVELALHATLAEDDAELVGERTVVYGEHLVEFDAGRAELLNLVAIPDIWPDSGRRWISATVTDSCGRRGQVDHRLD